jgi:hypothetical protein
LPSLSIETAEDSIGEELDARRLLSERTVRRANYILDFHKTDVDPWPSPLHGHDDKGLKLDAIIARTMTWLLELHCKSLKQKQLREVQVELRASYSFA